MPFIKLQMEPQRYRKVARVKDINFTISSNWIQIFKVHAENFERFKFGIVRPVEKPLINMNLAEVTEGNYNEWKFVIGVWHSLISPQLGQTTFGTLPALEVFVAELAVGFGPSTCLSRGSFGIGDDGFGKGLEVGMGPPRIFVLAPDFDELDIKSDGEPGRGRSGILPQILVGSCKRFGFCQQSSSSFCSEDRRTWHRSNPSGLRLQRPAFRTWLNPSDESKRNRTPGWLLHQLVVPLILWLGHDGRSDTVGCSVIVTDPLFAIRHGAHL